MDPMYDQNEFVALEDDDPQEDESQDAQDVETIDISAGDAEDDLEDQDIPSQLQEHDQTDLNEQKHDQDAEIEGTIEALQNAPLEESEEQNFTLEQSHALLFPVLPKNFGMGKNMMNPSDISVTEESDFNVSSVHQEEQEDTENLHTTEPSNPVAKEAKPQITRKTILPSINLQSEEKGNDDKDQNDQQDLHGFTIDQYTPNPNSSSPSKNNENEATHLESPNNAKKVKVAPRSRSRDRPGVSNAEIGMPTRERDRSRSPTASKPISEPSPNRYAVSRLSGCRVYVGNLPFNCEWQELKDFGRLGMIFRQSWFSSWLRFVVHFGNIVEL
jgi:hypothetical protein